MIARLAGATVAFVLMAGCGSSESEAPPSESTAEQLALDDSATVASEVRTVCRPDDRMDVEGRSSPYDSTLVAIGDAEAKVCYGRPSMRGREIFGEMLPYDTLWRTGANEPTTIHIPFPAEIAGLQVAPGSYSIYSVPGEEEWTVIVNRSTSQWGIEAQYTDAIRAQEVGRATVPSDQIEEPVETFEITTEETGPNSSNLVLEWETTRVRIPIVRM